MISFEVLIDSSFLSLDSSLGAESKNKHVVCLLNDYEDGKWRHENVQSFVWDNVCETALSKKERDALADQRHSALRQAAQNLRLTDAIKDISKGSELSEIILYGIMKHHYGALPVVPKIFYKQNAQDNAKGADSVHIVVEGEDVFSLWFGEAKFYNGLENPRLIEIVKSVGNSLKTDKLKKENSIVTNVGDLEDLVENKSLYERIVEALSNKNSIDEIKPIIQIPILLLHECNLVAEDIRNAADNDVIYKDQLDKAKRYFSKQIERLNDPDQAEFVHLYSEVRFHIILFPVPSKSLIVDEFVKTAKFYKGS